MKSPKPNTEFKRVNGRLALYHQADRHHEYWKTYWSDTKCDQLRRSGETGDFGEFTPLINRYLKKSGLVIEAGCGPGHLAAALAFRGYRSIGIDYEHETIAKGRTLFPGLDIRHGDILSTDFEDGYFGGYISIGVVEHFLDGPQKALREAHRVLDNDGIALISVPYLNPVRRKYRPGLFDNASAVSNLHFHQYYFDKTDFSSELELAGFIVLDTFPYAVEAFLIREHRFFSKFWTSKICRERIKTPLRQYFRNAPIWLRMKFGHMIMFVCEKNRN